MARQYPNELYLGQKVLVQFKPHANPITSLVKWIDRKSGLVHVNPIGSEKLWAAKPLVISSIEGQMLHFENEEFFFDEE